MYILGIESSCDETAASVLECGEEIKVCSNIIATQIDFHRKYGGVVPEIASRMHIEAISGVTEEALEQAGIRAEELGAVAVTYAPGLIGALLVGVNFAKGLAKNYNLPLLPVHHIEGHICGVLLSNPELKPPFVCLVASGGHSTVALVRDWNQYEILAKTRDDAPGEAFDKVSRLLGLGYPGGPAVSKAAEQGNSEAYFFTKPKLDTSDFSFSGIKTGVINLIHNLEQKKEPVHAADIAASFQKTMVEILTERLFTLAQEQGISKVAIAGGVSSNNLLRASVLAEAERQGMTAYLPQPVFCTDNAAMIAARGWFLYQQGVQADSGLNAVAVRPIGK